MEGKKFIKVSLGTVICMCIIFILILVILGMLYYYNVVKINNENIISNEIGNTDIYKNNTTNTTVSEDSSNTNTSLNISTSDIPELETNNAKQLIENYLNIWGSYLGGPLDLSLFDNNLKNIIDYSLQTTDGYVNTNINYNDFKNEMLEYMSEEVFETYTYYKNINGTLYAFVGGGSGIQYSDIDMNLISNSNNVYKYSVTCLMTAGGYEEQTNFIFTIIYENGNYVVSSMN